MTWETFAIGLVRAAGVYFVLGVAFAAAFVVRGVGRIDPAARGASPGFRLAIFPGVVALWPLLLRRWMRSARTPGTASPPVERNAHRAAAEAVAATTPEAR